MFKPEIIKGGKDITLPQAKDYKKETAKDSEIREERVFPKQEIIGIIEQITKEEGFKPGQLEVTDEIYDSQGNLIIMSIRVVKGRAMGQGWQNIDYDYMIKGNHGNEGFTDVTCVNRIYNFKDSQTSQAGLVAWYKNGKWELRPGEIAPRVKRVRRTEE